MDNIPEAMKEREQMVYEAFERVHSYTLWAKDNVATNWYRTNMLDDDIEILRAELGFTNHNKGNRK